MKPVLLTIVLFSSIIICSAVSSSIQNDKNDLLPIHIRGTILNGNEDTVRVILYPYYSNFRHNRDAVKFTVLSKDGNFDFNLPPIEKPYYISLYHSETPNNRNIIKLFLIEPGDSIHCLIARDTIKFSGNGSARFMCQYEIQQVADISFSREELLRFQGKNWYSFNKYRKEKMDSLLNEKLQIIKRFERKIGRGVSSRLQLDHSAQSLFETYNSLELNLHIKADSLTRNEQVRFFTELDTITPALNYQIKDLAESRSYLDYLMIKSMTDILIKKYQSGSPNIYSYSLKELFNYFQNKFNGEIYRRLLDLSIQLFYKPIDNSQNKYIEEAIQEAQNPYFKKILLEIQKIRTPGKPAYPFELTDTNGNTIKLADFAGKVIVMDFWFTGCSPCIALEKQMKIIRSEFKSDSSIIFISICLDTDKNQWLKSVQTGLYSDPYLINLYTNGLGFDDPLIKNYEISGCPQIVIIDKKQKDFSVKPPKPSSFNDTKKFIDLIMAAREH